jgi:hypothetical protein
LQQELDARALELKVLKANKEKQSGVKFANVTVHAMAKRENEELRKEADRKVS